MTELQLPDPPLADEAIALRPWSEADIEPGLEATQDEVISRFTRVPRHQTEEDLRRFVADRERARQAGEILTLAIAEAHSDEFLGTISLQRFDWPNRRAEVGYWLAPWARGRGVATRAVVLLSRWGLQHLGLGRLALSTHTDNYASQAVAARAGFTREGTLRSFEERDGRRYDDVLFSLLPEDLS